MKQKELLNLYESILHNIALRWDCFGLAIPSAARDQQGTKNLLNALSNWSYAHRVGNGQLTDREQQSAINHALKGLQTVWDSK